MNENWKQEGRGERAWRTTTKRHKINKPYFKHISSRKLANALVGPVSNQGIEGTFKENNVIVRKRNKYFPSLFPVKKHSKDSPKDSFSMQAFSQDLAHAELLEECGTKRPNEKIIIRMIWYVLQSSQNSNLKSYSTELLGVLYKNKDDGIRMRKSGEYNLSTFPNVLKGAKGKKLLWGNGKIWICIGNRLNNGNKIVIGSRY